MVSQRGKKYKRAAVSISSGSAFMFECPSPTPVLGKALEHNKYDLSVDTSLTDMGK